MKLIKIFSFVFLIALGSASAQKFNHSLNPFPTAALNPQDSVRILAVMVEFQKDEDANTFGDGTFGTIYSKNYGSSILDPLPHDKDYFSAHLSFAKYYFAKASGGKVVIDFKVLDNVIKLNKTMLSYSPEINTNDIAPLGGFAQDVWKAVDDLNVVDFSKYDMFLIFHAGVGRDVTLPGSLGLERDLPSVYLSYNSLKNIFGDFFEGFRVNNGNFKIKNTAVLPETESREFAGLSGTTLVQLSINGLIVSMIGSYLGLPDLYDTETGKTAIGRFGLMDGQSIFAYGGTFPPMPSAWEKVYLHWVEPIPLDSTATNVKVFADPPLQTIYKVPINATEYYLIENRQRDVNKDGAILHLWRYGRTEVKKFTEDTDGFYSFDVSNLYGVVTAIDELDWALPGSGILIWHIDEKVINEKLAVNRINADPNRRGVDLEEADGIQDIGVEFQTIFGDVVVGEGEAADFWFKENHSRLYQNKFTPTTKPNTNSNDGGKSLISITDFSNNGNVMIFNLSFSEGDVSKVFEHDFNVSGEVASSLVTPAGWIFITDGKDLKGVSTNNQKAVGVKDFSEFAPAFFELDGKEFLIGANNKRLNVYSIAEDSVIAYFDAQANFTTPVVLSVKNNAVEILAGNENGEVLKAQLSLTPSPNLTKVNVVNFFPSAPVKLIAKLGNYLVTASSDEVKDNGSLDYKTAGEVKSLVISGTSSGENLIFFLTTDGNLFSLSADGDVNKLSEGVENFSLGNLKNEKENYLICSAGNRIEAFTIEGAMASNFPFVNSFGAKFKGVPLAGDFTGNAKADVVASDELGNIFVINAQTGKARDYFPLSAGGPVQSVVLQNEVLVGGTSQVRIYSVTEKGKLFAWNVNVQRASFLNWSSAYGNSANTNSLPAPANGTALKEYFPVNETYNWPNPVYESTTHIRFLVNEDSKVTIKVMDLAGEIVKEINTEAKSGIAGEVELNVENFQSGVYFARIGFESFKGKTAFKIIKIAVIH